MTPADPTIKLSVQTVLRRLGLSRTRLRAFDAELRPTRGTAGERLYDPEIVDAFDARRRTAAEARRRTAEVVR